MNFGGTTIIIDALALNMVDLPPTRKRLLRLSIPYSNHPLAVEVINMKHLNTIIKTFLMSGFADIRSHFTGIYCDYWQCKSIERLYVTFLGR